jgi:hypothetical protein
MATDYLEYLEHTPTADLTPSALLRIALALETSALELPGGEYGRAHGRSNAAHDPHLVVLDEKECWEFLGGGGVGRVIFRSADRPVALPINFKTLAGAVIFRSALNGEVASIGSGEPVSFEVDRIDDAMSEGWSVLATGTVHSVRASEEIHEVQALGIGPWAGGKRDSYFRLRVVCVTGKRINEVR